MRLLRLPEVMQRVGLRKTAIYKLQRDGAFPSCVKIGAAATWVEGEIDAWINARMSARTANPTTPAP